MRNYERACEQREQLSKQADSIELHQRTLDEARCLVETNATECRRQMEYLDFRIQIIRNQIQRIRLNENINYIRRQ